MNLEHYKKIRDLVSEAENSGLLFEARELSGFSGEKLIGSLQRLAKYQSSIGAGSYLEVGVFQGLTLISVASTLEGTTAYGIDNFSQFDPSGINERIISERVKANKLNNIRVINEDYEDALENLKKYIGDSKIGLYFVDGPHDYRSQLTCLGLAKPYLSDYSIIVIDDCNYSHVRLANKDFMLSNPDFKLLFEAYTECHPRSMDNDDKREARKGWWNGVNIIVHDPDDLLDVMFPETIRDRELYKNEHMIHSAKYGVLAPDAVDFFQTLMSFSLVGAMKKFVKILLKMYKIKKEHGSLPDRWNTYSDHLPKKNFNKILE